MNTPVSRRERAERLRGYFELQLMLADRLCEPLSIPLGQSALRYTNLHRRFGLGTARDTVSPGWPRYAAGLDALDSFPDQLDWTVDFFANGADEPSDTQRFGCFTFDPPGETGQIRIHFSNQDSADGSGPLTRAKVPARIADLATMFAHIRRAHPAAETVRGASWLYNLDAYRRLFPPAFTASRAEPPFVRLDGTSSWGQLLDHRETVRPDGREAFLSNLPTLDPAAPWLVFPLRALVTLAPITGFYRFYGVP